MKKLLFIITFVGIAFIGIIAGTQASYDVAQLVKQPIVTSTIEKVSSPLPQATDQQKQVIGIPQGISIPELGVNAIVESVGKDTEGRMDIPSNWNNTAWYKYGAKPGEPGSAVIDGHVDTPSGKPSVFYGLTRLKAGDTITITDDKQQTYTFSVSRVVTYDTNAVPMDEIFAKTAEPRLNLITCGGKWDKAKKDYSERVVVYSELISRE